jgi:hypothetical protein
MQALQTLAADTSARPLGDRQAKIVLLGDFIDRGPGSHLLEAL